MTSRARVRAATEADLPGIAVIYDHWVQHSVATFDLTPQGTGLWRDKLASRTRGDHLLVALDGTGSVCGFAYSGGYRPRPAYHRTKEVSVYLAEHARGQGLGRSLYDELLGRLRADGVHTALAVVAQPNDGSNALHEACGFVHTGTLREVGDKFGGWVDVRWYQLLLG